MIPPRLLPLDRPWSAGYSASPTRAVLVCRIGTRLGIACAAAILAGSTAAAATATLSAARDNTLFEESSGTLSNGAGEYLFAGRVAAFQNNMLRRAVLAFDIAGSIPAGSTIDSVTLQLNMSRGVSSAADVRLHRALASWGEGASDAVDEEGGGAPAASGDATWVHRFYSTQAWTTPGGDFAPDPSAITNVGQLGLYTWSSPALVADVQGWLEQPAGNFGWMLIGDEEGFPPTSKRFDSRENATPANRPSLIVSYTVPSPSAGAAVVLLAFAGVRRSRAFVER